MLRRHLGFFDTQLEEGLGEVHGLEEVQGLLEEVQWLMELD